MSKTESTKPRSPRGRKKNEIDPESRAEIIRLHQLQLGTRKIRVRLGVSREAIRTVLEQQGLQRPSGLQSSKLIAFHDAISERVSLGLSTSRILREIQQLGFAGGRTILADFIRPLRAKLALAPNQGVKRRFETAPGEEMQIDWSPYLVPIDGRVTRIHALGCLLCASRKLHLRFYRNERQATLLEALAIAFEYFNGVSHRVVLDNMATAVLGRIGPSRHPLWHERFAAFAAHYGFRAFACRVRDPDRKGKKEKSFRYLWDDFLKGASFASWDDLDQRLRVWLDQTPGTGNLRVHGTTRRVPNEAYREEWPLLIRLPEHRFPIHEDGVRDVDRDATISVHGTRYTVPASLAARSVAVRLYVEHFEVLGPNGQIAYSRRYVADRDKGKLQIDPTCYAGIQRGRGHGGAGERFDEMFRRRFPELAPLLEGIQLRFKTLAPVQLRALLRLCDRYGEPAFLAACRRMQEYRRFDANAVQRVLEREHPLDDPELPAPLSGQGPRLLGEVEPASLDDYEKLDGQPSTNTPDKEDDHGT